MKGGCVMADPVSPNPSAALVREVMARVATGEPPSAWLARVDRKAAEVLRELNAAIQKGTLPAYLETVNPDELRLLLSGNWEQTPYQAILQVCNAKVAKAILAGISFLADSAERQHHVGRAFEVFNTPERLPILIEALQLGRVDPLNRIPAEHLVYLDRQEGSSFFGQLPSPLVKKALQIETDLLTSDAWDQASQGYAQLLKSLVPAGAVKV
jgi:hypothetical protein